MKIFIKVAQVPCYIYIASLMNQIETPFWFNVLTKSFSSNHVPN